MHNTCKAWPGYVLVISILHQSKKESGQERSQACIDRSKFTLEHCALSDLGFSRDMFTWRNNQFREKDFVKERLDRGVANLEWRCTFPDFNI
jgi:hypothetical protein